VLGEQPEVLDSRRRVGRKELDLDRAPVGLDGVQPPVLAGGRR
jgi:hypothetical protein